MNRFAILCASVLVASASHAAIIAQWNFNSSPPDSSTSTGSYLPSVGSGSIAGIGGVTGDFSSNTGALNAGSTDTTATDNTCLRTYNYPAQGTGSGTGGVELTVSTLGKSGVKLSFDHRHDAGSSRWLEVQADGGAGFFTAQQIEVPQTNLNWANEVVNLSSFSVLNNKASVKIRIVTIFGTVGSAGGSSYATVGNTSPGISAYSVTSTSGKIRYDMMTVTAVPEPSTYMVMGLGALLLIRRRKA